MPNHQPELRYWQDATGNREAVAECGEYVCIYCRFIGPSSDIREHAIESDGRQTVICPRCCIDAVVPRNTLPENEEEMMRIVEQDYYDGFVRVYPQDGDDLIPNDNTEHNN